MSVAETFPAIEPAVPRASEAGNEKPPAPAAPESVPAAQPSSPQLNLAALAETAMRARPGQTAFVRARPAGEALPEAPERFSNLALMREVVRLSAFLQVLRLPPLSPIAVLMPNMPEASAVVLAALHAGHRPLLLPCTLRGGELVAALEKAGCVAGITVTSIADIHPAEALREAAAACFGMRFVAAYGSGIPDGVIGLDLLPSVRGDALLAASRNDGIGMLLRDAAGITRLIDCDALVAGAMAILASARMAGGEKLVTLLPPDDLAGVATGLAAPLLAGMSVTTLDLFDSRVLAEALAGGEPCHLVAPAWLEPALAGSELLRAPSLRSVTYVGRAPWRAQGVRLNHKSRLHVVDIVEIDAATLLVSVRREGRQEGIALAEPCPAVARGMRLVDARIENDRLFVSGRGVARAPGDDGPDTQWLATGLRAMLSGGRIIALLPET